jgi:DNA-binding response OmpR family regulator
LARIENLLKRSYGNQRGSVLQVNDVSLNLGDSTVRVGNEVIELTKNELRILNLLMKNQGTIISRDDIMTELWQSDEFVDDNTLTVNINRLRKKLEEVGVKDFIQTKRGQGYLV